MIKYVKILEMLYEVLFYLCNEKHKCKLLNFAYNEKEKFQKNVTEVSMKENEHLYYLLQ